MAEIEVQRKRPMWLAAIIALGLVILVFWLISGLFGSDSGESSVQLHPEVIEPTTVQAMPITLIPVVEVERVDSTRTTPAAVREYLMQCTSGTAESSPDHVYVSGCIQRLSAALDAVFQMPGGSTNAVQGQLQEFRTQAERLARSPDSSLQHADLTRATFTSIASLLSAVQEAHYPLLGTPVDQLERMAEAMNADTRLLQQAPAVQNFFAQAGVVARAMAVSAPAGS